MNELWETLYRESYTGNKYAKGSKNFSRVIYGTPVETPHIYIIPRVRAGPSYKDVQLEYDDARNIQFCPVSKGYSMQDVSSFTLGPVPYHGLNVVNSAFSKCIAIKHIDGSGEFSEKNKNFWKKYRRRQNKIRSIDVLSETTMSVDGQIVNIVEWLESNRELWYNEWKKWHNAIKFSANGNFNWSADSQTVIYYNPIRKEYLNFVEWKKTCYIQPAYQLFEQNNAVIEFLKRLLDKKISIGLVHPMGKIGDEEKAITPEFIRELYDSPYDMTCMPYVVAGYLLGVSPRLSK